MGIALICVSLGLLIMRGRNWLKILRYPNHSECEDRVKWLGGKFDAAGTNKKLRRFKL